MKEYGKVRTFGTCRSHRLMIGKTVRIEEKIDGSQFSFMLDGDRVRCFSRSREIPDENPGQFGPAVAAVRARRDAMEPGWIYRGEVVTKLRHNVIPYDRTPKGFVMLWSVEKDETVFDHNDLVWIAEQLDLETVPCLGRVESLTGLGDLEPFVEGPSVLGNHREGIVIKVGELRAKIVGQKFRETAKVKGKKPKGTTADILYALGRAYAPEPRWDKALAHLRDEDKITGTPRDIGLIVREVQRDVREECGDEIRDQIFSALWPTVSKATVDGLALWYKAKLAEDL